MKNDRFSNASTDEGKGHATGFKFVLALALVTVLGPVATDMYLPSMPQIAQDFGSSYAAVQLTLTVFLLAEGAGQLFFGPVVDRLGRRRPLLAGISVFVLASVWLTFAGSVGEMFWGRLLQGLAAALMLVVVVSKVRDVSHGVRAAQLFALLMTIEGLGPVLAPTVGGFVDAFFGWRAVMVVFVLMGLVALVSSAVNLRETLPREKRLPIHPRAIAGHYFRIIRDLHFLGPALSVSMAFFFLFAYVGGATYVYQSIYGLSPNVFGTVLGATGVAVLLGALVAAKLMSRFGVRRLAGAGAMLILGGACLALVLELSGLGLAGVVAGMFASMCGLGVAEAALMGLAMSSQSRALGYTAALLGSMKLVFASAATPISGMLAVKGSGPWLLFLIGSGIVMVGLTAATICFSKKEEVSQQTQPSGLTEEEVFGEI